MACTRDSLVSWLFAVHLLIVMFKMFSKIQILLSDVLFYLTWCWILANQVGAKKRTNFVSIFHSYNAAGARCFNFCSYITLLWWYIETYSCLDVCIGFLVGIPLPSFQLSSSAENHPRHHVWVELLALLLQFQFSLPSEDLRFRSRLLSHGHRRNLSSSPTSTKNFLLFFLKLNEVIFQN